MAYLNDEQLDFWHEQGYLRIPAVFTPEEVSQLRDDLDWMIDNWAGRGLGWTGPWRKKYMDDATEAKSELIAMHDLHFYAQSWMRCVTNAKLCQAMGEMLEGAAELHHSTMHVKPPETGQPFPMHQDWAFYKHEDNRYVDVLVHLDDTCHENGEIRFLAGSHKQGARDHITSFVNDQGETETCTPHLSTDDYKLEDTVPVPAKVGDVVCFNIFTIHGSHINQTDEMRRMVRVGYKHPANPQIDGQSSGRPGLIVAGRRPRQENQPLFDTSGPAQSEQQEDAKKFGVKL